jgi:hypothetical protein
MPVLAAICETCHRPFPSGFRVMNSTATSFVGCSSGPCPWCGGPSGTIPDGVFDVDADDVVRLSSALPTTRSDLLKLAGILQDADLSPGADPTPVLARIDAEVPGATKLLAVMRDPAYANIVATLALILALLTWLGIVVTGSSQPTAPPTPVHSVHHSAPAPDVHSTTPPPNPIASQTQGSGRFAQGAGEARSHSDAKRP